MYHIYGMGNALVDMEFEVSDEFLKEFEIAKGGMTLVDEARLDDLLKALGEEKFKRQCGGSAANTVIAAAQMGAKTFYSCKVANDETGVFYQQDLSDSGVANNLKELKPGVTGKCLVLVTKDAERSMNSFLGITQTFSTEELSTEDLLKSEYLYIEGYLVASPTAKEAAIKARALAQENNIKVALTLSDESMVKFFREGLLEIIGNKIDLIFCNETEALSFTQTESISEAREVLKDYAHNFAITQGENGAIIYDGDTFIDIEPYKVKAIDSLGAGDMFAGAFLYALTHKQPMAAAGKLASKASSKVVSQYGPRLKWHETQEVVEQVLK